MTPSYYSSVARSTPPAVGVNRPFAIDGGTSASGATGMTMAAVFGDYRATLEQIPGAETAGRANLRPTFPSRRTAPDLGVDGITPESAVVGGTAVVLVVEDEPMVRGLVSLVLGQLGYSVYSAASGQEALDLMASRVGPIDLLFTDVVMPGMDGPELCAQLRRTSPALKCLYMSGYSEELVAKRGVPISDEVFLPKPFTIGELTAKVRAALGCPVGPAS